jgi:hypothetical protein
MKWIVVFRPSTEAPFVVTAEAVVRLPPARTSESAVTVMIRRMAFPLSKISVERVFRVTSFQLGLHLR